MKILIQEMFLGDIEREQEINLDYLPDKGDTIVYNNSIWVVKYRVFDLNKGKIIIRVKS